MRIQKLLSLLLFLLVMGSSIAQTPIALPAQSGTYCCNTRGYWFTAPADFTIHSLRVPEDASTADQSIVVVKLTAPPPNYSTTTTSYTTVAQFQNIPGSAAIPVTIPVLSGEVIGILGSRGGTNSYGPGSYSTTIEGFPVTLERFGTQNNIATTWPADVWQEPGGSISRVEFTTTPGVAPVPALSEWGVFIFALSLLAFGLVVVYNVQAQRQLALAGVDASSASTGFNFGSLNVPFERDGYFAMMKWSFALAAVGFVAIYFIWGEIIPDDLIGMSITIPVMAYILYMMKKK